MALPTSGFMSFSLINNEFQRGTTTTLSFSQLYRGAGIVSSSMTSVPTSGPISLQQFYGLDNSQEIHLTAGTYGATDLRSAALTRGWDGTRGLKFVVDSGVVIQGTSGSPALTITGSFPNGVALHNYGYIVGFGGNGGHGTSYNGASGGEWGTNPVSGGTAISTTPPVDIYNYGWIAGGGGGGGGGSIQSVLYNGTTYHTGAGGGGGGGAGTYDTRGIGAPGGTSYNNPAHIVGHNGTKGQDAGPFGKALSIYNGLTNAGPPGDPGLGGLESAGIGGHGGGGGRGGDWGANGAQGQQGLWYDGQWFNWWQWGGLGGRAIFSFFPVNTRIHVWGNIRGSV